MKGISFVCTKKYSIITEKYYKGEPIRLSPRRSARELRSYIRDAFREMYPPSRIFSHPISLSSDSVGNGNNRRLRSARNISAGFRPGGKKNSSWESKKSWRCVGVLKISLIRPANSDSDCSGWLHSQDGMDEYRFMDEPHLSFLIWEKRNSSLRIP